MRLLLDQGTPRSMAALLRQAGVDAVHTAEIGMAEAGDEEILNRAAAEQRVVVTLDADFHALLALSQARKPSVIRIRMEGLRAEEFDNLLRDVIQQCLADLEADHGERTRPRARFRAPRTKPRCQLSKAAL